MGGNNELITSLLISHIHLESQDRKKRDWKMSFRLSDHYRSSYLVIQRWCGGGFGNGWFQKKSVTETTSRNNSSGRDPIVIGSLIPKRILSGMRDGSYAANVVVRCFRVSVFLLYLFLLQLFGRIVRNDFGGAPGYAGLKGRKIMW